MVDEQLRVDTEHLIKQLLVAVFVRPADGAFCDVAHRVDADGLELFGVASPNTPEVRQRTVLPELSAVAHFVKLRNADAVFIRRNVLCHDVHGDLAEIEVCADARRGRDACGAQHIEDHGLRQFAGRHVVGFEVAGHVHHHLINGVDVNILGRNVFEVDIVDLRADLNVFRHLRRCDKIPHRTQRISRKLTGVTAFLKEVAARFALPFGVDLLDALDYFEKSRSAGDAVGLQGRRHGKADGLLRAAEVCHDQIGRHRVKPALHAFDGRVIRF